MSYYDRHATEHLGGAPIFQSKEDRDAEDVVATELETKWRCELHHFGTLAPIDWYSTRYGRLVGVLELKHRSHTTTKFDTVFLNVRKWLALSLAEVGLGVPALFVVQFLDEVRWCHLQDIDGRFVRIAGCKTIVKSPSDIEPVIEVPIAAMRPVKEIPEEAVPKASE